MMRLVKLLRQFLRSEDGATATEYAVIIALIIIVVMASVSALGEKVSDMFVDAEQGW